MIESQQITLINDPRKQTELNKNALKLVIS